MRPGAGALSNACQTTALFVNPLPRAMMAAQSKRIRANPQWMSEPTNPIPFALTTGTCPASTPCAAAGIQASARSAAPHAGHYDANGQAAPVIISSLSVSGGLLAFRQDDVGGA